MKKCLQWMGIGAAGGAGLLLVFWLLGDVAHVIGLGLQDSSFFLGMVFTLSGLLMIVRGGPSSKYVNAFGHPRANVAQAAANPDLAMGEEKARQKEKSKTAGERRPAPYVCLGIGLLNLAVCGLTLLVAYTV